MMSSKYSIKQSATLIAALCLMTEFSFGQVDCQNGYDYKNSCNPYKIKFIKVPITPKKSDYTATENLQSKEYHKAKSYLDTLLNRYSSNYNGEYGLQAVIDRSAYKTLELKKVEDSNNSDTKKSITKKSSEVVKKEVKPKESKVVVSKIDTIKKVDKVIKQQERVEPKKIAKSVEKIKTKPKKSVIVKKEKKQVIKKVASLNKKSKIKESYKLYTIKKGDSLIKIAKKFNISTKKLRTINSLDKNSTVKIGFKLKLPSNAIKKVIQKVAKKKKPIKKNSIYYVVKKGDTLSKIAKKSNVSITKLREINRLSRSGSIRVGEKIYLKPTKLAKRKNRSFNFAKNIKFKKSPSLKHKRKIRVVATAYTSHRNQTDNSPFLAAWNNRIHPGMRIIAVSPDLIRKYGLTNGVKVKIMGLPGFYTVRDKMNKRLRNHIDIYMGVNKRRALRWGRRRIVLYW